MIIIVYISQDKMHTYYFVPLLFPNYFALLNIYMINYRSQPIYFDLAVIIFKELYMFSTTKQPGSKTKLYFQEGRKRKPVQSSIFPLNQNSGYKKNQTIKVTNQEMQNVHNRINLQQKAAANLKIRQASYNMFLKYNYNPFLDLTIKNKKKDKENLSKTLGAINIINQMLDDQNGKKVKSKMQQFEKANHRIVKQNIQLFSGKKVNQIQKDFFIKTQQINKFQHNQPKKREETNILDIDEIVKIKDDNFFFQKKMKVNIFKLSNNQIHCISAYDHLVSRKFSFDSMIEKNFRFRSLLYRDLSRLARGTICCWSQIKQKIQDYLSSMELKFSINYLLFEDLLNFASNRISATNLESILARITFGKNENQDHQQNEDSDFGEDFSENYIQKLFKNNNKKISYNDHKASDLEGQQIKFYYNLPFTRKEEEVQTKMKKCISEVDRVQNYRRKACEMEVRDKGFHLDLSQHSKQKIKAILQGKQGHSFDLSKDTDRITRQRKNKCDRSETIRLKFAKQVIENNQKMRKTIKEGLRQRL